MVHCPVNRTQRVLAVGCTMSSLLWACVTCCAASMQGPSPHACAAHWQRTSVKLSSATAVSIYLTDGSISRATFLASTWYINQPSCAIVPLLYSIPHQEEVFPCLYHRIALSIARLLT